MVAVPNKKITEINEPPEAVEAEQKDSQRFINYSVTVREYCDHLFHITATDREDLKRQLAQRMEEYDIDDMRAGEVDIIDVRVCNIDEVKTLPEPKADVKCRKLPVISM